MSTGADERSQARVVIDADNSCAVVTGFQPAVVGGMKIRRRQYDGAADVVGAVPWDYSFSGKISETWVMHPVTA